MSELKKFSTSTLAELQKDEKHLYYVLRIINNDIF